MSEIIASGIIDASALEQWAETFTASTGSNSPLVHEAKVHFNEDGISVSAADPANVAMVAPTTLHARAFESYESPGSATVGIDLTTLLDRIDYANAGDLIEWAIDMETRHLSLEYGAAEIEMALIDPESIRKEPDEPDLPLPNTVVLEASDLEDAVEIPEMVGDHVEISCDPEAREVVFAGAGDTDSATVRFGDEELIDADVNEATMSLFSLSYLEAFVGPMPTGAEVTLELGDEFPMVWEWSALEGDFEVRQMCAPRIQSS